MFNIKSLFLAGLIGLAVILVSIPKSPATAHAQSQVKLLPLASALLLGPTAHADSCSGLNESCEDSPCCGGLACAGEWPDVYCQ